jgi:large subunit ribosomal protein L25
LHFVGDDIAPGVKTEGGAISHVMVEVELECLPKDIPEFIEVDLSGLHTGESIHLSELKLPAGVAIVALKQGDEHDTAVASCHARKGGGSEAAEEESEGEESED